MTINITVGIVLCPVPRSQSYCPIIISGRCERITRTNSLFLSILKSLHKINSIFTSNALLIRWCTLPLNRLYYCSLLYKRRIIRLLFYPSSIKLLLLIITIVYDYYYEHYFLLWNELKMLPLTFTTEPLEQILLQTLWGVVLFITISIFGESRMIGECRHTFFVTTEFFIAGTYEPTFTMVWIDVTSETDHESQKLLK